MFTIVWKLCLIAIESLIMYSMCGLSFFELITAFCFMSNKLYIHNKYIKGVGVSTSSLLLIN